MCNFLAGRIEGSRVGALRHCFLAHGSERPRPERGWSRRALALQQRLLHQLGNVDSPASHHGRAALRTRCPQTGSSARRCPWRRCSITAFWRAPLALRLPAATTAETS
ncbi:unnamed protein product, partial [Phaeothamnion confervicola]